MPWTTYFLFRDYFGLDKYMGYMLDYLKYFLVAAGVGVITYVICEFASPANMYLALIARGIICVIVPNVLYLVIFRRNANYKDTILFVKSKIKKNA
jgi:EamA domain-containing membrane protein RarD